MVPGMIFVSIAYFKGQVDRSCRRVVSKRNCAGMGRERTVSLHSPYCP